MRMRISELCKMIEDSIRSGRYPLDTDVQKKLAAALQVRVDLLDTRHVVWEAVPPSVILWERQELHSSGKTPAVPLPKSFR